MTDPHRFSPVRRPDAEEADYFLKRAEDHRRLAERSVNAPSRTLHLRFQELYRAAAADRAGVVPDQDLRAKIPGTRNPMDG